MQKVAQCWDSMMRDVILSCAGFTPTRVSAFNFFLCCYTCSSSQIVLLLTAGKELSSPSLCLLFFLNFRAYLNYAPKHSTQAVLATASVHLLCGQVPCAAVLLFSYIPWCLAVSLTSRGTGEITLADLGLPWVRMSRAIPTVMGGGLLPTAWDVRQKHCSYSALQLHSGSGSVVRQSEPLSCSEKSSSSETTKYCSKPKRNFSPSSWFNFNPEMIQPTPRSCLRQYEKTVWSHRGLRERLIYFSGAA